VVAGGVLYFTASDGRRRRQRLRALEERRHGGRHRDGDGHQPGARSSGGSNVAVSGVTLFFSANNGVNGIEL
jgi:hypothetical protein